MEWSNQPQSSHLFCSVMFCSVEEYQQVYSADQPKSVHKRATPDEHIEITLNSQLKSTHKLNSVHSRAQILPSFRSVHDRMTQYTKSQINSSNLKGRIWASGWILLHVTTDVNPKHVIWKQSWRIQPIVRHAASSIGGAHEVSTSNLTF
jgi:hypothetical protein